MSAQPSDMAPPQPGTGIQYDVEAFKERFFSGTIDPTKLSSTLNSRAADGWRFARSITSNRRVLFIFKSQTHFLVFERTV